MYLYSRIMVPSIVWVMKFCMGKLGFHTPNKIGNPLPPALCNCWVDKGGIFKSFDSETLDMTCEVLGEMFEGDFADKSSDKFPLNSMGKTSRPVKPAQTRSQDLHFPQRKLNIKMTK
jgi:hypothetical protein